MGILRDRVYEARERSVEEEEWLLDVGVIEPTADGEDIRFTDEFADLLQDHLPYFIDQGVSEADIGVIFDIDPDEWVEPRGGDGYEAYVVANQVYKWPSPDALVIDAATEAALDELTPRWEEDIPARQRYRIIMALRGFHDTCVFCEGPISVSETPVESCCEDYLVYSFACEDCDRRYLEFSADQTADNQYEATITGPSNK